MLPKRPEEKIIETIFGVIAISFVVLLIYVPIWFSFELARKYDFPLIPYAVIAVISYVILRSHTILKFLNSLIDK
jgi:hypothetical protein